jgi:peptidoglycan hydrolase-like protein with peptidoglycan-binding domain
MPSSSSNPPAGQTPGQSLDAAASDANQAGAGDVSSPASSCSHWVEFRYVMADTDFPIGDSEPWTLVYPTGKKETGLLSDGKVRRDGVPAGTYQLQPKYLAGASWGSSPVYSGEKASIQVKGENVPDGEAVEIRILRQYQSATAPPLEKLNASFNGGVAKADWTYQQQTADPPFGNFVALAIWKSKSATSPPLSVQPYPVDQDKGLQQRLKHMGFYSGAIDGIVGSATEAAVRKMQDAYPPLVVDGIAGSKTRELLAEITY